MSKSGCGELAIVPVGIRDNHALSACADASAARDGGPRLERPGGAGKAGALMRFARFIVVN